MKTIDQILSYKSNTLDGRDMGRLLDFIPVEKWKDLGFTLKDGAPTPVVQELTREAVMARLTRDLDFAFEKALNQRGLSAGMMFSVIKMWMWVLDDELANHDDNDYAQYGLPLFKKVAVKYNLPNPIGEDYGDESKYACDSE